MTTTTTTAPNGATIERHTAANPCPICGGYDGMKRGKGIRCHGYTFIGQVGDTLCMCSQHEDEEDERFTGRDSSGYPIYKIDGEPFNVRFKKHDDSDAGGDYREVDRYAYRDKDGSTLYEAVRRENERGEKRFHQGHTDASGKWVPNLDGVPLVLYRLPELLAADPAAPVYLVEGEKDVHTLAALGFVATCNPMGAGKWDNGYSEYLRDRNVVILPDNDDTGKKHGGKVRASLGGKAASVKMLDLPGLPEHGDVTDWLAMGGTASLLQTLVKAAPADETGRKTLYRRSELSDLPQLRFLVEGFIPERGLTVLYGMYDTYKTFTALDMGACLSLGFPWHGHEVEEPRSVLYLTGEGQSDFDNRLSAWEKARNLTIPDATFAVAVEMPDFLSEEGYQTVRRYAQETNADVIFVDTVQRAMPGHDENGKEMGKFVAACDRLRHELRCTVVAVHHTGWDDSHMRGHTSLPASTDVILHAEKDSRESVTVKVERIKSRKSGETVSFSPRVVELPDEQSSVVLDDAIRITKQHGLSDGARKIGTFLVDGTFGEEGATATQWEKVAEEGKMASRTFYRGRQELVAGGYVTVPATDKDRREWRYCATDKLRDALGVTANSLPITDSGSD